jgi:hypothetical protein
LIFFINISIISQFTKKNSPGDVGGDKDTGAKSGWQTSLQKLKVLSKWIIRAVP